MIDVVIPLNQQSVWNNNELRFTLRSLEAHIPDLGNVYLVGTKPAFCRNVIHLPFRDKSMYAAINIYQKVKYACEQESLSEHFIYANDDHYLLPGFVWDCSYYDGDLETLLGTHPDILYKKVIRNTLEYLLAASPDPVFRNYDIHTPISMGKRWFLECMGRVDWTQNWGYGMKSLYGNLSGLAGAEVKDGKIRQNKPYDYLREFIKDKVCLSSGDRINDDFKRLLTELYPYKSKYEH